MSTVLITNYTENITNLIPKVAEARVKSPRYRSKYHTKSACGTRDLSRPISQGGPPRGNEDVARDKLKSGHRTFGVARVQLNPPSEFLKKRSRITPSRPEINHVHPKRPGDYQRTLPAWKPTTRKDLSNSSGTAADAGRKNFRLQNIINAKISKPKEPAQRYVDTRYGKAHELAGSGLLPIYVFRKGYGKVPKFIMRKHRSNDIDVFEEHNRDRFQPSYHYITQQDREDLLRGMKKRWDEMTKQFQCLPFLTDTPPKAKRKAKMEEDLKELEKDIDVIERHPYICVYDDDDDD